MAHRHLPLVLALAALAAPARAQEMDPDKLAKDVTSGDAGVRHQAAETLNRCGFDCHAAVPALVKMFQLPDAGDRSESAFALHQILDAVQTRAMMDGKDEKAAVAADCGLLRPVLRSRVRGAAPAPIEGMLAELATLKLFGICGEAEDVPSLVAVMSAPAFGPNARKGALESLGQMGPTAAAAVPAIKTLGTDPADQNGAFLKRVSKDVLANIQPAPAKPAAVKKKK